MPENDSNDISQMFREIAAYGAVRFLDPNAAAKLYNSNSSAYMVTPDGQDYIVGQNGDNRPQYTAKSNTGLVLTPTLMLILGVIIYFIVKEN